jgi:hypothetical protein
MLTCVGRAQERTVAGPLIEAWSARLGVRVEHVVVHELAHLLEPTHSARFIALMDRALPAWRERRDALNRLPLGHEDWDCSQRETALMGRSVIGDTPCMRSNFDRTEGAP